MLQGCKFNISCGATEASSRASQEAGVRSSREGPVPPRPPSSVLSTAELTGLLQEEVEGALSHEGIVLHDAPLLRADPPGSQPPSGGGLYACKHPVWLQ